MFLRSEPGGALFSMKLCWQKWKLTNTPVHADKEGGNKRALNREHSENHYEGSDEPAESRSSSFPPSPRRSAQCALSLIQNKDWCCLTHYWWCPRLGLPFPLPGLQRAWKDTRQEELSSLDPTETSIQVQRHLLLLMIIIIHSPSSKDEHVWAICYERGKLETSWLVWSGFCFSPQILTSRTLVRIRGSWQRSSHLLPRETRTWLSECCLHADPGFRGGSVGWPSIRVLNLKIQRKKKHTLCSQFHIWNSCVRSLKGGDRTFTFA